MPGADAPDRQVDLQRQLVGDHRPVRPAVGDEDVAGLRDEPTFRAAHAGLHPRPGSVGPRPHAPRCQQLHHVVVLHPRQSSGSMRMPHSRFGSRLLGLGTPLRGRPVWPLRLGMRDEEGRGTGRDATSLATGRLHVAIEINGPRISTISSCFLSFTGVEPTTNGLQNRCSTN